MKLIDLKPHWISLPNWVGTEKFYVGLSFLCPHCQPNACPTCGNLPEHKRLAVYFWPPIDPSGMLGRIFDIPDNGGHRRVAGEDFNTISLSPSIGFEHIGHWHGMLTNGETIP